MHRFAISEILHRRITINSANIGCWIFTLLEFPSGRVLSPWKVEWLNNQIFIGIFSMNYSSRIYAHTYSQRSTIKYRENWTNHTERIITNKNQETAERQTVCLFSDALRRVQIRASLQAEAQQLFPMSINGSQTCVRVCVCVCMLKWGLLSC